MHRAVRGGAVIVHGLNVRPSAMDEVAVLAAEEGFLTYRMALSGHSYTASVPTDTLAVEREVALAFDLVSKRVGDKPLIGIGYSFGGLLLTRYAQSGIPPRIASMTLLAPALSLRSVFTPLSWLTFRALDSVLIPSFTPKPIRRFCSIPAAWYRILFEAILRAEDSAHYRNLQTIPSTVVIGVGDEFVSLPGLTEWISRNAGSVWHVTKVNPLSSDPSEAAHILTSPRFTGAAAWDAIKRAVRISAEAAMSS